MDKLRAIIRENLASNKRPINAKYFEDILNRTNNVSQSSRDFLQKVINTIKKNNGMGTQRQYDVLKRFENGGPPYSPKN